jgi:glycosyltransferase involved in cell wall biosynthesis
MKIAIDARFYGTENAGLGRYTKNLIENLVKIDNKNTYFLILNSDHFKNIGKLPKNFNKVEFNVRHYSVSEQLEMPTILKNLSVDLVHIPHFNIPVLYNEKILCTIHDLTMHKSRGKSATTQGTIKYLFKRIGYRFVFDSAIKRSAKIIVPSNFVRDDLNKYYSGASDKSVVIYEGVDENFVKHKGKDYYSKKDQLIYVGNAYPHKNLKTAIMGLKMFNSKFSRNVKLLIITPRTVFYERLENLIEREKMKEFVRVVNYVDDEVLVELIHQSKAFIYPSLEEGFGLPGLEAMAVGTLLLASDIPIFREIYEDNAVYFNPRDESAVSDSIKHLFEMNKNDYESVQKRAKEFSRRYSWKKMAEETVRVYEGLNG